MATPGPSRVARRASLVLLIVVGLAVAPGTAAAETTDPRFEALVPEPTVEPGRTAGLTVQLLNDAADPDDTARTAGAVRVEMLSGGTNITVESGERAVGDLSDGAVREVPFRISVPADIPAGTYDLPIEVTYEDGGEEATTTVTATVRVEERARFELRASATDAPVGGGGTVTLEVANVGSAPARAATVTVESTAPAVSFGGSPAATRFVGAWAPGETKRIAVDAAIAATAETRPYALRATVSYETTGGDPATSAALATGITPEPEQAFAVGNVTSSLRVDGQGSLAGTVTNEGPRPVRNAVVVFRASNPRVAPLESEYAVGDLAPGESADFSFEAAVDGSAEPGPRQFSLVVRYRDDGGDVRRSDTLDAPARIGAGDVFRVRNVTATLRVGEEGVLRGEVVNAGETAVRNAVVRFAPEKPAVNPIETEAPVGDLAPGEAATFAFEVEVSENAGAGPRQFTVSVRYRDRNDDVRQGDPIDLRADVGEKRRTFGVEPVSTTVEAGSAGSLTVRVTNNAGEQLSDISVKAFVSDPISASDDEAFVDGLAPGESATVEFRIAAGAAALAKEYPVSIDFQYDDADGDTLLSDTYEVPVSVTEPTGGGPSTTAVAGAAALVALVLVGGYLLLRRR